MNLLLENNILKAARFAVQNENSLGLSFPELQVKVARSKKGKQKGKKLFKRKKKGGREERKKGMDGVKEGKRKEKIKKGKGKGK